MTSHSLNTYCDVTQWINGLWIFVTKPRSIRKHNPHPLETMERVWEIHYMTHLGRGWLLFQWKIHAWPWNLMDEKTTTIGHLFYATLNFVQQSKSLVNQNWGYSLETPNSGQRRRYLFVPWDLEVWWMILKNHRAPLLCCVKLCASYFSHQWIQTEITVRKRWNWVKVVDFRPVWPRNLTHGLET